MQEESLLEKAPEIQWPTVREGKTEGYMIVYARTDRTGQVRETAKHNSDQPGLEEFGMEQALHYKFKPLVVHGVPQQMEMPLVLHFSTHLADPLPMLSAAAMKKQLASCTIGKLPAGTARGTVVHIRVSVNESGKITGMQSLHPDSAAGINWLQVMASLQICHPSPYLVNGKPMYHKGEVDLVAP